MTRPTRRVSTQTPANLQIEAEHNQRGYYEFQVVCSRSNTYLQVTATPQALFLQRPNHQYRPSFTVLTEPGKDYVGGEAFFGQDAKLVRLVDVNEITALKASNQPSPKGKLPAGLKKALCSFFVGAASKIIQGATEGFAFLLHVSLSTKDHDYARLLLDDFKQDAVSTLKKKTGASYTGFDRRPPGSVCRPKDFRPISYRLLLRFWARLNFI